MATQTYSARAIRDKNNQLDDNLMTAVARRKEEKEEVFDLADAESGSSSRASRARRRRRDHVCLLTVNVVTRSS